jgi:hypothetical protein
MTSINPAAMFKIFRRYERMRKIGNLFTLDLGKSNSFNTEK